MTATVYLHPSLARDPLAVVLLECQTRLVAIVSPGKHPPRLVPIA